MNGEATTMDTQALKNQVIVWVNDCVWKYAARVGIIISILGALGFLAVLGSLNGQVTRKIEDKLPGKAEEIKQIIEQAKKVSLKHQELLKQLPIGSIIPVGIALKTNELAPNWVLCNGQILNEQNGFKREDISYLFWNKKVPNLNDGRFLRGTSNLDTVGKEVGTNTHSHQVSVSGGTGGPSELAHGKDKPDQEEFGNRKHTHNVTATGTASEVEYIPPSIEVFYIIKINH
ncbi:MAG: hypothetical protein WBM62_15870 [Crocosphaera sp.]